MELGSEYSLSLSKLSVIDDNIFSYLSRYNSTFYFDSGRSAIKHFASQIASNVKVLLPEFICESVSKCFKVNRITYYRLNDEFIIDTDDLMNKTGNEQCIIFLMHYFGSLQPKDILDNVRSIADKNKSVVIEDTTHSIFTKSSTIGDYMVCSIRKWLPIAGGGVLYFNNNKLGLSDPNYPPSHDNLRSYGMILKDLFLNEQLDCNLEYRDIFAESENKLNSQKKLLGISDLSRFIASCINIRELIGSRCNNYGIIRDYLLSLGINSAVRFGTSDIPFVLPLRVPERDKLRSYLAENKIYCAVHWPFDGMLPEQRPLAKQNANELISLPIDQRYSREHMEYLIEALEQYGGELSF